MARPYDVDAIHFHRFYQKLSTIMSNPIIRPSSQQTNNIGRAGFIAALLSLAVGIVALLFPRDGAWTMVLSGILCLAGFILSFAGLFSRPRKLAYIGLVITISIMLMPLLLPLLFQLFIKP